MADLFLELETAINVLVIGQTLTIAFLILLLWRLSKIHNYKIGPKNA